jgi:hypothetical protein
VCCERSLAANDMADLQQWGVHWELERTDWPPLQTIHLALFVYGVGVLGYMVHQIGCWPCCTYTVCGWIVQTARLGLLAWQQPLAVWLAERLRFLSMAMNSTTFLIWWVILVPTIYTLLPSKHQTAFGATCWHCYLRAGLSAGTVKSHRSLLLRGSESLGATHSSARAERRRGCP